MIKEKYPLSNRKEIPKAGLRGIKTANEPLEYIVSYSPDPVDSSPSTTAS